MQEERNYLYQEQDQADSTTSSGFYSSSYKIPLAQLHIPKFSSNPSSNGSQKPIIQSLHLAHNLTFIAQVSYKKIHHYSSEGVLIFQHTFNKIINFMFMASSTVVILLLRSFTQVDPGEEIVQMDLRDYSMISLPFYGELKELCGAEVFTESKLFAIKQHQSSSYLNTSTKKLKLSYYSYPLSHMHPDPTFTTTFIPQTKGTKGTKGSKLNILKLNNKSKIGLVRDGPFKLCQQEVWIYHPFQSKQKWKNYQFQYEFQTLQNDYEFLLMDLWEIGDARLYIRFSCYPDGQNVDYLESLADEADIMAKERSFQFTWNYKTKKRQVPVPLTTNSPHINLFRGQTLSLTYTTNLKTYQYQARLQKRYYPVRYYAIQEQKLGRNLTEIQMPIYYLNNEQYKLQTTTIQAQKFRILDSSQPKPTDITLSSIPYSLQKYLQYWQEYNEDNNTQYLNIRLKIIKQLGFAVKIIVVDLLVHVIGDDVDQDLLYCVAGIVEDDDCVCYQRIQ